MNGDVMFRFVVQVESWKTFVLFSACACVDLFKYAILLAFELAAFTHKSVYIEIIWQNNKKEDNILSKLRKIEKLELNKLGKHDRGYM